MFVSHNFSPLPDFPLSLRCAMRSSKKGDLPAVQATINLGSKTRVEQACEAFDNEVMAPKAERRRTVREDPEGGERKPP